TFAGCRQSALEVEGVRSSSPETGSFIWMMMFCAPATPAVLSVWPAAASYPDRNRAAAKADAIFIQSCWSTVRPMAERELWPSISGGKRSVSMFPPSGVPRSGPLECTAKGEFPDGESIPRMECRNGFRHTYTGKAEIQIAKCFFRTVHRSGGVRHVLIVSIPGIRIPIADPLHAVIRHVIDTQRVGWQAAAHWN